MLDDGFHWISHSVTLADTLKMSSLQVRRPEDVGTPDSEAKGRNHPLYFVGTPRDSLLILMRRVMRNMMRHAMRDCVRTKRNTTRAGA